MPLFNVRIAAFFLCLFFVAQHAQAVEKGSSKLVLVARLFKVEIFKPEEIIDALDEPSVQGALPSATAVFLIKQVRQGKLPQPKISQTTSTWSQAKDALKEKNFLKMVTMDFQNPNVEHENRPHWFAVGVQSPFETFKVISWTDLPQTDFRLVLKKEAENSGWVLVSAEQAT